jgi:type VI secretion system secreted protein VgrG
MYNDAKGSDASFFFEIKGAQSTEVVGFEASERLTEPFLVDVTLAAKAEIKFNDIMQKEALLTVISTGENRYFHGIVRRFELTGKSGLKYLYGCQIVPFTQLLFLEQDCRIFQNKNVQEIIADIFKDSGVPSDRYEFRLKNKEHKRRFCVQYRETDLKFINRILQEEGIYYFYEHSKDKHLMVFADDPVYYKPIAGNAAIAFKPASGLNPEDEVISNIDFSQGLCPGTYTQTNYNFKHPSTSLETKEKSKDEKIQKYEIYDYPGQYGAQDKGKKLTKTRMEGQTCLQERATGASNCPRLISGHTFKLDGHNFTAFDREYLLVTVNHDGVQSQTLEEQAGTDGTNYHNTFTAIPSSVAYHPGKPIKKPYIHGIQTATVVGPENEEIYVDEYGRVKVQFHWDRKGKKNEQSSCWLRCGQTWGGAGRGTVFIPRIGDEVIVSFLEGDPDWPIITGSVYNGDNLPLYDLPGNKTRSTIRTKSYPRSNGYNELRFEDKAGSEEVYLQGEKDWNILIKNDKGQAIGHDETLTVGNNRDKTVAINQSESIGQNKEINVGINHTEHVESNMTRNVGSNKFDTTGINSMETIGLAKELTIGGLYQISVGGVMNETVIGAKSEEVGAVKALIVANDMTEYVMNDRKSTVDGDLTKKIAKTQHVQADEYILEATERITLKAGASTITMDKNSITITSPKKVAYRGPGAAPALQFDKPQYDDRFQLVDLRTGKPLADYPYKLQSESGIIIEGRTDSGGYTNKIESATRDKVSILIKEID